MRPLSRASISLNLSIIGEVNEKKCAVASANIFHKKHKKALLTKKMHGCTYSTEGMEEGFELDEKHSYAVTV